MTKTRSTNIKKFLKLYYVVLVIAVAAQTVLSCVRLAQTVAYQDRLAHLESSSAKLRQELETKQAQLNDQTSLLSHQSSAQEEFVSIESAIKLSAHDTIALR